MTPHGQHQVNAAKADGRWDAAYAGIRDTTVETLPPDLAAAIEANPRARTALRAIGRQDLFALVFRTNRMKTAEGRARKIAALVDKLARDGTIVSDASRARPAGAKPRRAGTTGTHRQTQTKQRAR
jgi:uncharacterized protein YdeI (YjbR/CyaY-like superfamily)